jgi:OPA family sugar phosphate sensor protein UhpC-like MFS transporter
MLLLLRCATMSSESATYGLVMYEGGGVIGTLISGPLSDVLKGKRNVTCFLYSILLIVSVLILWVAPQYNNPLLIFSACFMVGLSVNGPKTLAGIIVREMNEEAAGTAGGALGLAGQVGASLAGYPVGLLIQSSSSPTTMWNNSFLLLLSSSVLTALMFGYLSMRELFVKGTLKQD